MKNLTVIRTNRSIQIIWAMILAMVIMVVAQGRSGDEIKLALGLLPSFGLGWTMVELRCDMLLHPRKYHN